MSFPKTPRVEFNRNPLISVICQLRFPTILSIATTEPAGFQEKIRGEYPIYEKQQGHQPPEELAGLLQNLGVRLPGSETSHTFKTESGTRHIGLTRDFVAITDEKYRRWEEFSGEIMRALEALEDLYHPNFYTRVGLRYVDVINRSALGIAGVDWHELINPQLLGALGTEQIGPQVKEIETESLIRLDETEGFVKLRHGLRKHEDRAGETMYVFDSDFFIAEKREKPDVSAILHNFHEIAGNLFRWAIKPKLHRALDPQPIS